MDQNVAYIGIGSNLDDPERQVQSAIQALARLPESTFMRASRLYRTLPWGMTAQPPFVNAAVALRTRLAPRALLDALLAIERAHGRRREGTRWGPRTLDLDILLYGDQSVDEDGLRVPHPRIAERAFVLMPLADLDADRVVPGSGKVRDLLARVDTGGCTPIDDAGAP
ncbi:MAG TPA: 2-amino-4-hydroxy-6-hydroxymethyldihydropteridine diphosphokinase [Rhodanobacteraceae bacterium]|nr:2-amino-4-hydroxy-6-hydroxymethyldihydropteridine diphosphokinase [Rhodanobacteraceae bacterium]